jgi:hypothetical protein
MEIVSKAGDSRLSIEVVVSGFVHPQTLNLSVTVADEGFLGASEGIWVGTDEYRAFIAALHQGKETGWGSAALASISPGKLGLRIVNAGGLMLFQLHYRVCRTSYKYAAPDHTAIMGGFDLDPERWAQHVSDFESLLPPSEQQTSS